MNKDQKKPQDMCQTHPHSFHKNIPKDVYCNHCEKPQEATTNPEETSSLVGVQEDIWEGYSILSNEEGVFVAKKSENGNFNRKYIKIKDFIRSHFISRKTLRKVLEEKKRVMAHIVGAKRVETPYVVIDDIKAELKI